MGCPESFAVDHWGRRPMHRATDGARTPLDAAMLDDWLAHGARRPNLRLVQAGRTLDERSYTRSVRMGGAWVDGVADPAKVASLVAQGATLVGQNLEVVLPSLRRFVAEVQHAVSHPVQANVYLTPSGSVGLGRHADTHDVLVLQVDGRKTWSVDGLGEVDLSPGDVLYVPRGTMHAAWTTVDASIHLTIGVLCVTVAQVVRAVLDRVDGADERLPLGFAALGPDAWRDALAGYMTRVAGEALALDGAGVAAARRLPPVDAGAGWLAPLLRPTPLDPSDRLRRMVPCRWRLAGDRVLLSAADRDLSFPAVAAGALEALCGCEDLSAASLPGLDGESQLVVARRLVREGILVRVPR